MHKSTLCSVIESRLLRSAAGTSVTKYMTTSRCVDELRHVVVLENCADWTSFFLQGLSVTEIQEGYELALKKAHEILPGKYNNKGWHSMSGASGQISHAQHCCARVDSVEGPDPLWCVCGGGG